MDGVRTWCVVDSVVVATRLACDHVFRRLSVQNVAEGHSNNTGRQQKNEKRHFSQGLLLTGFVRTFHQE